MYIGSGNYKTKVFPVVYKIIFIFIIFILTSNIASNYINLILNRNMLISQMKQLLAKDLKDINNFCNNQFEIFQLNKDKIGSINSMSKKSLHELKNSKSVVLLINQDRTYLFQASSLKKKEKEFSDKKIFDSIQKKLKSGIDEGYIQFKYNGQKYFGAYKYNKHWDAYLIRAEEENEFYKEQRSIFRHIAIIIVIITIISAFLGILLLRYILRFIQVITNSIMKMAESQQMEIIDLKGAPNDDITFLGVAFNSFSNTINNLINIFKKFVNQDIVAKAYKYRKVNLEGAQKELTILFSDIKSFTFITETLGADIIQLLNVHYDNAIREIIKENGLIGAIIGDALLAIYGAIDPSLYPVDEIRPLDENKSLQAIRSAYNLQQASEDLRQSMREKKKEIEKNHGKLSKSEMKVYKAVLLEVGVGIDGGEVFYGTIGSHQRMTNTVIGDNVNASSRLEGLTRIYRLPVICSEYVRADVMNNVDGVPIQFIEIDTVQVKGKTIGTKIYWPILNENYTVKIKKEVEKFNKGLQLYYKGEWKEAYTFFESCKLEVAKTFVERTQTAKPAKWNGIWEMKTK